MERVSVLLGHSSIKVTGKHYSPWVRARQEQLEADVRRTWQRSSQTQKVQGVPGARSSSTFWIKPSFFCSFGLGASCPLTFEPV